MKERDLLDLAVAGNERALQALLQRHGPTVMSRIKVPRDLRGVLSAEDVMQQTYCDVMADFGRFVASSEAGFRAWLCSLAKHNLCSAIRMLRAERRGGYQRRVQPSSRSSWSLLGRFAVVSRTASRDFAREERCTRLRAAIAKLPPEHGTVLRMFDIEQRPMEEVARRLGKSPGAAYMLRRRAMRLLEPRVERPSSWSGPA
ncbi:MAG: sigma-70 family RNA polymerase sigma factor [bacterium]|nr:sigma-70 family RNA polymerase sigma factor [bacterium]